MKTICAITGYRSDYVKLKSVLTSIKTHDNLKLKIIAFGPHTLNDCGDTFKQILDDGFTINEIIQSNIVGNGPESMTKSMGVSLIEITSALTRIKPDATLIVGDRFEIMSAALASSINNIPVIHIQGGEISGTIDEVLRHSVTKLSHLHFPSTDVSAKRILQMGEDPRAVINVGCPAIDFILSQNYIGREEMNSVEPYCNYNIDFTKEYAVVVQHSVTTEYKKSFKQMTTTLEALQKYGIDSFLIYPNPDAGSNGVVRAIRMMQSKYGEGFVIKEKVKNLSLLDYLNILKYSKFIIGNSSSGIREAHVFNTPAINIGTRQKGRERTPNIIDVEHDVKKIFNAMVASEKHRVDSSNIYGDGQAGAKIAQILNTIDLNALLDKRFCDI